MKHSELIERSKSILGDSFNKVKEIRKGSSSGTNYINILFETEEDMKEARLLFQYTGPMYCMKRYGFGIIFN